MVFNRYIRRRDTHPDGVGRCCSCGGVNSFEYLEAGHYVHNCSALRFDERNVHAQCTGCNKYKHGNPTGYAVFLIKRYGPGILMEFETLRKSPKRWRKAELQEMLETYKAKLKKLEG